MTQDIKVPEMVQGLQRFNDLVSVHGSDESDSDTRLYMRERLGISEEAIDTLVAFIATMGEDNEDDQHIFLAGFICGATVLDEVTFAEVIPIVPDAPPPDLAA